MLFSPKKQGLKVGFESSCLWRAFSSWLPVHLTILDSRLVGLPGYPGITCVALVVPWWIELISHSQLLIFRDFPTLPTSSSWGPDAFSQHLLQFKNLQKISHYSGNLMPRSEQIGFSFSLWRKYVIFKGSRWAYGCFSFQHRMEQCFGDSGGAAISLHFKDCKLVHTFSGGYNLILYLPRFKMQILLTEEFYFLLCIPKIY